MSGNVSKELKQQEQRRKSINYFSGWVRVTLILCLMSGISLFTENFLYISASVAGLTASLGYTSWLWFKKILPLSK